MKKFIRRYAGLFAIVKLFALSAFMIGAIAASDSTFAAVTQSSEESTTPSTDNPSSLNHHRRHRPNPITISGTPAASVVVGSVYSFTPTLSNPSDSPVTFSVQGAPHWATFDTKSGHLTGAPISTDVGTTSNIIISATNGNRPAVLPAFSIVVVAAAPAATYTVTYNGNGSTSGATPTDPKAYAKGATVTVLGNTGNLVRTGFTFSGWNSAANGSGTAYAAGSTFSVGSAKVTLYAQWTAAATTTIVVAYNGNGSTSGAAPTDTKAYTKGATVTVLGNTGNLARTGYTFAGWNATANGSGTAYAAGSTFSLASANVTLYAQWTAVATTTLSVAYNGNGSTSGAAPLDSKAYAKGASVTVLGNTGNLARTGFTFSGWNATANGSGTAYSPGNTFAIASANVTLYAQWVANDAAPSVPPTNDPTTGIMPSYNDAFANWKNAGLASVSGIPTRTTICATVNPLGGGQDDFNNIQNAINSCAAGKVVQLGAGAFSVHVADLPIHIATGITLRGTGDCSGTSSPYCQTSISVSDGALAYTGHKCGTSTANEVTCPNGGPPVILMAPVTPDYNYSWAKCGNVGSVVGTGCGAIALAADAAQGQATIQLTSTSGLSVGQWVLIDEASGAGWMPDPLNSWTKYGAIWAASDWLSSSGSPATGRIQWSKSQNGGGWDFGTDFPYQANSVGCWFSYCDRPTAELHKIASIGTGACPGSGCTITFDDPLTIAFRQSGNHNAQVYGSLYADNTGQGSPISLLQSAGVENLSVLRGVNGGMEMELCAYCWIKNTEVGNWYGGGINIAYSVRSELNTVYVHHCWDSVNSGTEYPIALDTASTEILITNSITNFGGKGMVARAGGAGSVVSYSYVDDTMYDAESGIGDYWLDMGLNASHYSGPHHVLFEGDWADNLDSDDTHGDSTYITFFRNESTGMRTPFTDSSIGKTVDDSKGVGYACGTTGPSGCWANPPGPLRAAGPMAYNYWFAFVGNVLGLSGVTTAANGWSYEGDWSANRIFMLGWNGQQGGQDPYLNGVSGSYIFRSGNYDYLNVSIPDWASGYSHALPNSFYLSSAPSFFSAAASCTYAWPWVTPTGSNQVQKNSCGGSGLPAKARYEAGTPFKQP